MQWLSGCQGILGSCYVDLMVFGEVAMQLIQGVTRVFWEVVVWLLGCSGCFYAMVKWLPGVQEVARVRYCSLSTLGTYLYSPLLKQNDFPTMSFSINI